jgi:hypothetical protein
MAWDVEAAVTEDQWTEEYVRTILASRPTHTPPTRLALGEVTARWFPTEPGIAFIETTGGTVDDRIVAEAYLREWLRNSGWKQAQYSLYRLNKVSAWPDIENKAKRLIQSGNVQLLRNGPQNIVGHVVGDHGEYQTEISREDPNSQTITQWQCDCPWDQYAWQRTRQWKKYEGRPCAHVLATYWASQSAPLDEEASPGQPQQTLFDPGTGQPPGGLTNTPAQPLPQPAQLSIPGISVPPPEAPKPPEVIPPLPQGAPAPPGVVSVPGARPPTPADPTQYPGGTFSKVADAWDFSDFTDETQEYGGWKWVHDSESGETLVREHTNDKPIYHSELRDEAGIHDGPEYCGGTVTPDGLIKVWSGTPDNSLYKHLGEAGVPNPRMPETPEEMQAASDHMWSIARTADWTDEWTNDAADGWKFTYNTAEGQGALGGPDSYHLLLDRQVGGDPFQAHSGTVTPDGLINVFRWPGKSPHFNINRQLTPDRHPPRLVQWLQEQIPNVPLRVPQTEEEAREGLEHGERVAAAGDDFAKRGPRGGAVQGDP